MIRYYITDRHAAGGEAAVLGFIRRALEQGIDYVQIREKDLPARRLLDLVRAALALPNPHGASILVNDRVDIALAAGAHGVHLPSGFAPSRRRTRHHPVRLPDRRLLPLAGRGGAGRSRGWGFRRLRTGVLHRVQGAVRSSVGPERAEAGAAGVKMPVLALGGVKLENAEACMAAGAAGIAGIGMFQGK